MLTVEDHLQAAISSRVMSERIAARTHVKFDGIDFYLDDASATDFSLGSLGRKAAVESVRIMDGRYFFAGQRLSGPVVGHQQVAPV